MTTPIEPTAVSGSKQTHTRRIHTTLPKTTNKDNGRYVHWGDAASSSFSSFSLELDIGDASVSSVVSGCSCACSCACCFGCSCACSCSCSFGCSRACSCACGCDTSLVVMDSGSVVVVWSVVVARLADSWCNCNGWIHVCFIVDQESTLTGCCNHIMAIPTTTRTRPVHDTRYIQG